MSSKEKSRERSSPEAMGIRQRLRNCSGRVLFCLLLGTLWETGSGQIRYSVPEEKEKGSFVGDLAKDLGLEPRELSERRVRIVSRGRAQHFSLNSESGYLSINEKIDREELCGQITQCLLTIEILVESPVKLFAAEIEILDINDNIPSFQEQDTVLEISEVTAPGTRFFLPDAHDPDVGRNSLHSYSLSNNQHFSLEVKTKTGGRRYAEMILEKPLDREIKAVHSLTLTATDGGDPARSGTTLIRVKVLDVNDNAPIFDRTLYQGKVREDIPRGSPVVRVKATDKDEGSNSLVTYSLVKLSDKDSGLFVMDPQSGEIKVEGNLDFEAMEFYELEIQAKDSGGLSTLSKVLLEVVDVNDNAPEITVTSLFSPLSEESPPGTVIALLNVHDRDSGDNGKVTLSIQENLPFRLTKSLGNYYSLVSDDLLDREVKCCYNITIRAQDGGLPPLSSSQSLELILLDENDNPPFFPQKSYVAYLMENNPVGASIFAVKATDPDWKENAQITYSVSERSGQGLPLSSYVSINSETGVLYALRSFDYEQFRELQLQVTARDGGTPALHSNVSVTLLVLDENDNAPAILYPSLPTDGSTGVELAPRSAERGYLVTKVVAVDGDSGQNAWLSYRLLKATEPGLFSVGLHTGEIRTARDFLDKDALKQSLVVVVKDNGEPPLSATVTVTVAVADSIPEILSDLGSLSTPPDPESGLTLYLVVAVAAVSCLFLAFIIVLLALRLRRWRAARLLESSSGYLGGVPASQFVGIDGVRAFLQTYSHEVSLTTDSRKSQLLFPKSSHSSVILDSPCPENKETPVILDASKNNELDASLFQVRVSS
ncbi:protocadherin gamma-A10-like [Ornithorhynchus anatinus]|uniref:protocadherin gamma-A10-like n=1 Tax=Ornithorhynchus anatinus TaxID=9258 RepID=UPI0019D4335D|nr:protocadherin gamma-A10-like [Ornithorhynchus anatinus]